MTNMIAGNRGFGAESSAADYVSLVGRMISVPEEHGEVLRHVYFRGRQYQLKH